MPPYSGSGVFTSYVPGNPVTTGTIISSTVQNNTINDIATGLSTCITRDGQTTLSANIPMGGFKLTGLAAGATAGDSVRFEQLQNTTQNWVVAGGTADVITATYSPAIVSLVDGQLVYFRASAANATTTPTFSPNGLTARTITKNGGTALVAGDIPAALAEVILRYNLANTRWELLDPTAYAARGANTDITSMSALATISTAGGTSHTGAGGFSISGGNLNVSRAAAGATVQNTSRNLDNTNSASNALLYVSTGGPSSGDPMIYVSIDATSTYTIGIDNSDNDKFKISIGAALGTNDAFSIDSSGITWIGTGQTVATANAPVYSSTTARAWVKFTTVTTTSITASLNVTSLTDNGTGDTTINFTSALPSANYTWAGSCQALNVVISGNNATPTSSALRVIATSPGPTAVDSIQHVIVIGG